jgi:citrate lyase subunit beta/citryl-CoA lyase
MIARSKLFVPASRPELFPKALNSQADVVCFDLEDSVLPEQKAQARQNLQQFLSSDPPEYPALMVRVNHVTSPYFREDMAAAVAPDISVISLPKVEDAAEIAETASALLALEKQSGVVRPIGILATIESPRGLRMAKEIAQADKRVMGLQLGLADLFEPLGIASSDRTAVQYVRLRLRLAAGEVGIPCFDSAFADFQDQEGFTSEAQAARTLGFAGKSCIHPCQLADANRIFSPEEEEIDWARRIVDAAQSANAGVFAVDGRMVDAPFLKRAHAILALAAAIQGHTKNS